MTAPTFVFKLELRGTSRLKRNVLSGCSALSDGKTMRIAQIAPLAESVPPKATAKTKPPNPIAPPERVGQCIRQCFLSGLATPQRSTLR
jgi:hypothetical protein